MPVDHILTEFTATPSEFQNALRYWNNLVREVLQETQHLGEWRPFLSTTDVSDTPRVVVVEPGAMTSRGNEALNRAFIIEQLNVENQTPFVVGAMDEFGRGCLSRPVEVLSIKCEASIQAVEVVKKWLALWIDPHTTYEMMLRMVEEEALTGNAGSKD